MMIHQFRPIASGAELQAERLGARLANKGCEIGVLTELRTENTPEVEESGGLRIYRAKFPLAYRIDHRCIETFRYLFRNRKTFDIIHAHMAFGHAVVGAIFAKWFNKKSIVKIACAGEVGEMSVMSKFKHGHKAIDVLKTCDAVVAISSEVRRELISYGFPEESIYLIPNGVDTNDFRRRRPYTFPQGQTFRFVQIGRRTPQKGLDVLFDTIRQLVDNGFGDRFVVDLYGWDYPEYDYRAMSLEKGVSDNVRFFGFSHDIKTVIENSHCMLLPSRQEGLSNVLLECMSMELPVIASEASGSVDVIEDGLSGLLVQIGSVNGLYEAMVRVMNSEKLCMMLSVNGRRRVCSNFSMDYVADQYYELYGKLLGTQ